MIELNKIYNMDCLNGMEQIESYSIDCIVTDPPYGLKFMGKDWDKSIPSVDIWKECFRVLKSGAFAFVMCSPRQDVLSQMIVRLGQAGFDTGFTSIYWAYSGFPKSENISKAVDKKLGVESIKVNPKPYTSPDIRANNLMNTQGKERLQRYETIPNSDEAKKLEGAYAGFQPKPAVEVILVAMKPLSEKNFVNQALKNGKGVTWLDDCKIPYDSKKDFAFSHRENALSHNREIKSDNVVNYMPSNKVNPMSLIGDINKGRFPANLLVSDDVLNDGKITKSFGGSGDATKQSLDRTDIGYGYKRVEMASGLGGYGDVGSFSRYFDLDKWWDERIKELSDEVKKVYPFLIVPKASKSEREKGLDKLPKDFLATMGDDIGNIEQNPEEPTAWVKNIHPTVKLMSYLVTLGSREGDAILDPFVGSGTTAVACIILSRNFICFEINEEYCRTAELRLKSFGEEIEVIKIKEERRRNNIQQTLQGVWV